MKWLLQYAFELYKPVGAFIDLNKFSHIYANTQSKLWENQPNNDNNNQCLKSFNLMRARRLLHRHRAFCELIRTHIVHYAHTLINSHRANKLLVVTCISVMILTVLCSSHALDCSSCCWCCQASKTSTLHAANETNKFTRSLLIWHTYALWRTTFKIYCIFRMWVWLTENIR